MATCKDLVDVGFDTAQARVLGNDTGMSRQNFTPVTTASGSMTVTSIVETRQPWYQYIGEGLIFYLGFLTLTTGGAAAQRIRVSLPVPASASAEGLTVWVRDAASGLLVIGDGQLAGGNLEFYKTGRANWTLGASRQVQWRIIYEVNKVL